MEALRSLSGRIFRPSPPRPSPTPPRPFWVLPGGGEGRPRGVMAASLEELREQVGVALALPLPPRLALAQDGTLVENEEFFGILEPHSALVALGPGEQWEPLEAPQWPLAPQVPEGNPEVAKVSLLVAKGDPRGRLRLSAQIRGLRWDLGGIGAERIFRELLRALTSLCRALGQSLLSISAALRPLLEPPRGEGR